MTAQGCQHRCCLHPGFSFRGSPSLDHPGRSGAQHTKQAAPEILITSPQLELFHPCSTLGRTSRCKAMMKWELVSRPGCWGS